MKYAAILIACLFGVAYAQEKPPEKPPEGEKPAEGGGEEGEGEGEEGGEKKPVMAAPVDPAQVLNDLTLANLAKDATKIGILAKDALGWAKSAKSDDPMIESLGAEFADSIKAAKGNAGTIGDVIDVLGELRSKAGAKTLRHYATMKKPKDAAEEKVQARALVALSRLGDPKDIPDFEEASKSDSVEVAKAAYKAFEGYGTAKGKVRKQCAEILMKRLDMEYPSSGGQGGKNVSKEKQERWGEVSVPMVASMKALCKESTINDVDNWREWWKENKKNPKAEAWKDDESS